MNEKIRKKFPGGIIGKTRRKDNCICQRDDYGDRFERYLRPIPKTAKGFYGRERRGLAENTSHITKDTVKSNAIRLSEDAKHRR